MEVVESLGTGAAEKDKNLKKRSSSSPHKTDHKVSVECQKSELAGHPNTSDENDNEDSTSNKRIRTTQSSPNVADEAGSESPVIPEKLEIPSKELQCIQKQVLIEKLMGSPTTSLTTSSALVEELMDVEPANTEKSPEKNKNSSKKPFRVPQQPSARDREDFKRTFKIRSSILDRVKTFLPELKNANEELLRLPDPSKISLESDSDEIDGAVPGPSGSNSKKPGTASLENKTYVEMNLALLEHSDSDTSSDDENDVNNLIANGRVKGLPSLDKKDAPTSSVSPSPTKAASSSPNSGLHQSVVKKALDHETVATHDDSDSKKDKSSLITELN